MEDDAQKAFERDHWQTIPPNSSLARMHSALLISPSLLQRQQTRYIHHRHASSSSSINSIQSLHIASSSCVVSPFDETDLTNLPSPGSLQKLQSNASDGTPITIWKEDHIAPDWYHLSLHKISQITNSVVPDTLHSLERQQSVADVELQETCQMIEKACKLRHKWLFKRTNHKAHQEDSRLLLQLNFISIEQLIEKIKHFKSHHHKYSVQFVDGICKIYKIHKNERQKQPQTPIPADDWKETELEAAESKQLSMTEEFEAHSFEQYLQDLQCLFKLMAFGPAKTLSYTRLKILQRRFQIHMLLNRDIELTESSSVPYRDFYNVRKVDNNIHLSACMHQKHLLQFIRNKFQKEPHRVVTEDGKTLKQVFDALNVNVEHLSVDQLNVQGGQSTFQRFDKFDAKYNPMGQKTLRTLFLKIDNHVHGEYLAGIVKKVIANMESQKYQCAEFRISVHGFDDQRWDIIANWVCENELFSSHIRWLIQIPRLYQRLKQSELIDSFHDILHNIFSPLFKVTLDPSSNPKLHLFLESVVGLDCVGDESQMHGMDILTFPSPKQWTDKDKAPPYGYYLYYIYVNLYKLNKLREKLGFNTFAFRPQSGETGSVNHLAAAFLLSQSINHGIRLYQSPILQYLYYLEQVGIAISPLSNNILFLQYDKNPFPRFFQRGLNVSLSTDDPLLIHMTPDALLEEYSIAAQVYSLSAIDLCEIARNSVMQSGWKHSMKQQWIGAYYHDKQGAVSNDIYRTNVPNARLQFRHFLLQEELTFIAANSKLFMDATLESMHVSSFSYPMSPLSKLTLQPILSIDPNQDWTDCKETTQDEQNGYHRDDDEQTENELLTVRESNITFRSVEEDDMQCMCTLLDEIPGLCTCACSKQQLCYRFIFERQYMMVMTLNASEQIIGFVSGEIRTEKKESDNECCYLYLDAVVIEKKHIKCGYGAKLLKYYIAEQRDTAKEDGIVSAELCCTSKFILFFVDIGFEPIGRCDSVEHDHDDECWQMTLNLQATRITV